MEKSPERIIKKFTSKMQAKLLLVFCIITLLMIGLMGRLVFIMQTKGEAYAKQVLSRETYVSSVLPYKRGDIMDRNGTVLASSALQYKLILDPKQLLLKEDCVTPTITALQEGFEVTAEELREILDKKSDSQYVIVLKNLNYESVEAFKKKMEENKSITGIWFEQEYVRTYPYSSLACDILGFTSADNNGYFGIEEYYNQELNGTNGREYGYFSSNLDLERIVKKPVNGNSIISTIDLNAQRIIQEHIKEFNTEFGSKSIGVLVMNPNNGEIIAMASNQEYDLNNPRELKAILTEAEISTLTEEEKKKALNMLWKNDIISSGFEPGSTFKPITIAAGLEENVVSEGDTFYCDGFEEIGDYKIKCSKRIGHGEITLGQSLMLSCNDALMQIAAKEGKAIFGRYQNSFGFGKKTGIDLPGEETGVLKVSEDLDATDLATYSFGQNFNTTMIQLASAYSSLVNGGFYYKPHVVKKIINENGAIIKDNKGLLVKKAVSDKTSEFIQKYMYQTVEAGTAGGAKVEGYSIGGKTGTAQKQPRESKTYVVSFLGQVPAINPEIVIYVVIDEPQNVEKQADSSIATKFTSRILKELLPAVGIYPEGEIDYLLPQEDVAAASGSAVNQENGTKPSDTQEATQNQDTPGEAENTSGAGKQSQKEETTTGNNATEETRTEDTEATEATEETENPEESGAGTEEATTEEAVTGEETTESSETEQEPGVTAPEDENEFNADALE